jgi:hypothetical protein
MKTELNKIQNEVAELRNLFDNSYEGIFRMYKDQDEFYAYNISRTVQFPAELHDDVYYYLTVSGKITWVELSFEVYGDIKLWWLICLVNKIMNPVKLPESGSVIKILRPDYVPDIIDAIKNQA